MSRLSATSNQDVSSFVGFVFVHVILLSTVVKMSRLSATSNPIKMSCLLLGLYLYM